jgi:hypothetical protein
MPICCFSQVWREQFNGLPNGTTVDSDGTVWSTISPSGGAASFSKQTPVAGYELLLINDTGTEGAWLSQVIDIAAYGEVAIEVTLYSNFTFSSDYIKCFYKINGGAEVQFGELQGNNGLNITSAASAIVTGNTLQIIIRGKDNTPGLTAGVINALAFDDVTITNISVLYSRISGNWSSVGTWSTEALGGNSCNCIPNGNSQVIIGNNNSVSIPSIATSAGVTIQNTGRLQFTGNTTLTMARGGTVTVETGGVFNANGGNGTITYGAYAYSLVVNGNLSIATIQANTGSNLTITGAGSVNVSDFLVSSGNGRTITLNVLGGTTISNDLSFQSSSSNLTFINQQPLTIGNRLLFASGNVNFYNQSTISAGSLVVNANTNNGNILHNTSIGTIQSGAVNLNNGDFTLNNSGTINQTGNFSNVDAGSRFNNLNGGVWNFAGGGVNSRIFCNSGTNTFNYNASGVQTIFVPADAYSNLVLSGTGLKTLSGTITIKSNLSIGNAAQLDVSAFDYAITLAGNWNNTSSHANSFVERSGTVTFNGNTDQTIAAASGSEVFYSMGVNKISGNVVVSSSTPTDVSIAGNLQLTNGGFLLNGRTLLIANSGTTAITRTNGCIISETTSAPYSSVKWSIGTATGAYVFPFGKTTQSSDYIPFTLQVTGAGSPAAGSISVVTYATNSNNYPLPAGVTQLSNNTGSDNSPNVVDRFWHITLNEYLTNPTTTVTFVATPSEVGAIGTLMAQRWNSSAGAWDAPKAGQTNPNAYSATVPDVNTFSPWTMSGNSMPLPIELLYFDVELYDGIVNIQWQTLREQNNHFYTIQKSTDFETFTEVAIVPASQAANGSHYKVQDLQPWKGKSYYRLKQTDFDGEAAYFDPVMIAFDGEGIPRIDIFPVPLSSSEFNLTIQGVTANKKMHIDLFDAHGQKLQSIQIQTNSAEQFSGKIIPSFPLPSGVYILKINDIKFTRRIIVE